MLVFSAKGHQFVFDTTKTNFEGPAITELRLLSRVRQGRFFETSRCKQLSFVYYVLPESSHSTLLILVNLAPVGGHDQHKPWCNRRDHGDGLKGFGQGTHKSVLKNI